MKTKTTKATATETKEAKAGAARLVPRKDTITTKPRLGRVLSLKEGEKDRQLATKATTKKEAKPIHACPCCGASTKSTFAMGHDGRVHGLLLKVAKGKLDPAQLPNDRIRAMVPLFLADQTIPMKKLAEATAK